MALACRWFGTGQSAGTTKEAASPPIDLPEHAPKPAPPWGWFQKGPNFFQLFHQLMALFWTCQEFKLAICNALHSQAVEIPLPTNQNCWNGMCVARKTLNVHSSMAARALQSLGVRQLHVGQYGCKMHQDPLAGLQTRLCSLAFPAFGMAHPEDPGGILEVRASGSGMALKFVHSLLSKFSIRCRLMRWRRRWRRWKCWLEQLHLCANSWEALRSGVGAFKTGGWTPSWLTKCTRMLSCAFRGS